MLERRQADRQRRGDVDRRQRLSDALQEMRAERRAAQRRAEMARRCDDARANALCARVYDAYVRGHGAPPPLAGLSAGNGVHNTPRPEVG